MWSLPSIFLKDTSRGFSSVVRQLREPKYRGAVILGNGPSLSLIDDDAMRRFEAENYLTIGLNRTIYRHLTRVLIWSDVETLHSILGTDSIIAQDDPRDPMFVVQAVLPVGAAFREQVARWETERSFGAFPSTKLFMFRTVLTAALHLCHILGIKKVFLAGVDLDTRTYFFQTPQYDPSQPYELRDELSLQSHFKGYSTHRIVKEALESLISRDGFDIRYFGDSGFLKTVEGLKKAELNR